MTRTLLTLTALLALSACGDKDGETATLDGDGTDGTGGTVECDLEADPDCDTFTEEEGDCEPNNATAYPGARELPYDGLDNDCAGDGDLTDVDGDGFDATLVEGGTDCNDSNPDINPDAEETCYDNIDYDCDGFPTADEPETNDCDGDGFDGFSVGGDDCDDEDATIFPGAEEIWYDGVDQNCSGTIENDYDQDGDGEERAEDGGSDCNDEDPTVGFDQPELLDGVDGDCDGVVDTIGQLDASMSFFGTLASGEGWFGASVVALDDYDGDGNREVAFGAPFSDDDTTLCNKVVTGGEYNIGPCGGWLAVMPMDGTDGAPGNNFHSRILGNTGASEAAQGSWLGFSAANLGDLNGDGWAEVAVGATAYSGGSALIFNGADLVAPGDVTLSDALSRVSGSSALGGLVEPLSDVDGDGLNEIIAGPYAGIVALYYGASSTTDLTVWSSSSIQNSGVYVGSDALASLDDTGAGGEAIGATDWNGDGTPDVLVGTNVGSAGAVLVWDGDDIASGGAFGAGDYNQVTGPTGSRFGTTLGYLEDIDGDGYPEAAVAGPYASGDQEGSGVIYIIDGDDILAGGSVSSQAMATVSGAEYYGLAQVVSNTAGDVDGDGLSDLLFADLGGTELNAITGTAYVVAGSTLASGGSYGAADAIASLSTRSANDIWGTAGVLWDMDGDGDSEVAISAPFNNDVGMGAIYINGYLP